MSIEDINKELKNLKVNSLSSAIKENLLQNIRDVISDNKYKISLDRCLELSNIDETVKELEYDVDEMITNFIADCITIEEDKCL